MISAFLGGLQDLARRPLSSIPALAGLALNAMVLLLALESFQAVFLDSALAGELPNAPLSDAMFYFVSNNFADLGIIALALICSLVVSILLIFAYSKMASAKKGGIMESISFALSKAPEAAALGVFVFIALLIYSLGGLALFMASISLETFGAAAFTLFLLYLAFGAYASIKLAFTPLFISVEGLNIKKALAQSWKWSSGKFIPLLLFLFLLGIAGQFISGIAGLAFDAIALAPGASDFAVLLGVVVLVAGVCVSSAYYNTVFAKYFIGSRQ